MSNSIKVSIICNTYNHEPYIEAALEGFVSQKTNFGFEVLVHDDASTDGTAAIIRKYAEQYPDLIKPICQEVNQYSQSIKITRVHQLPRAKGEYIAFCEGDDYWVDENKLQKQYDALEQHPEVDICAHGAYTERDGQFVGEACPSTKDTLFTVEEVIINDGDFVATASLLCRKRIFDNLPEFYKKYGFDYSLQIMGALAGGMLYLKDKMCVYRLQTASSWTVRTHGNQNALVKHYDKILELIELIREDTQHKYDDVLIFQKNVYLFNKAVAGGDLELLKESTKQLCSKKAKSCYKHYVSKLRFRKIMKYRLYRLKACLRHAKGQEGQN